MKDNETQKALRHALHNWNEFSKRQLMITLLEVFGKIEQLEEEIVIIKGQIKKQI